MIPGASSRMRDRASKGIGDCAGSAEGQMGGIQAGSARCQCELYQYFSSLRLKGPHAGAEMYQSSQLQQVKSRQPSGSYSVFTTRYHTRETLPRACPYRGVTLI